MSNVQFQMTLFPPNNKNIAKAANIIREGGLVSFPTETVYGIGADALNPVAVAKIFEVKNRPSFDPLIIHIDNISSIEKLTNGYNIIARKLMENFWPGPLTLVLPKSKIIPDIVTAGLTTVAIRIPANETALKLISQSKTPIAAPSANPFGYLSPTTAWHVAEQLGNRVNMILDGGSCRVGIESTIIKVEGTKAMILRPGGLPLEQIEEIIGNVKKSNNDNKIYESPGQLPYHYSPHTPVKIIKNASNLNVKDAKAGLLAFKSPKKLLPFKKIEVLSPNGDVREAATNLFSSLHRLDHSDLDIIYAEAIPEIGLGRAIMDRLYKSARKQKE